MLVVPTQSLPAILHKDPHRFRVGRLEPAVLSDQSGTLDGARSIDVMDHNSSLGPLLDVLFEVSAK